MSLNEQVNRIESAKADLKAAINNLIVDSASRIGDELIDAYAAKVPSPNLSAVNVTSADMLQGAVALDSSLSAVSGGIATVSAYIDGSDVIVPSGYIATSQSFSVSGGVDPSGVTALPSDVTSGAYFITSDGTLTAGTLPVVTQPPPSLSVDSDGLATAAYTPSAGRVINTSPVSGTLQLATQSAITVMPTTSSVVAAGSGTYLLGDVTVSGDPSLTAANIKAGASVFGVVGTYTNDGTATASQILSGGTAFVSGSAVAGEIPIIPSSTYTPTTSDQTIVSGNYLGGNQTILGDAYLLSENIKAGTSIFGVVGNYEGSGGVDPSGVTALPSDVTSGTKFITSDGSLVYGTLPVVTQPAPTISINSATGAVNASYTPSAGRVTDTSGKSDTLQLPTGAGTTILPTTSSVVAATAGTYLLGDINVSGDAALVSSNIKVGTSVFGVSGTFTADADATSSDMLAGVSAYAGGVVISGSIQSTPASTYIPTTSAQIISSGIYLGGTQTVAGDMNLVAGNIKSGTSIFGVVGSYEGSGGGGGGSPFDVVKVTQYTPYRPPFTAPGEITISGLGSMTNSTTPDFGNADGVYAVTSDTTSETDLGSRVYTFTNNGSTYYLYRFMSEYEGTFWCVATSMGIQWPYDAGIYAVSSGTVLSSGGTWYNQNYFDSSGMNYVSATIGITSSDTVYPEIQQVLGGVVASSYNASNGKFSYGGSATISTFETTPQVDYVYATSGTHVIGSAVKFSEDFPGNGALFALDANSGTNDLIGGGSATEYHSSGDSAVVLQDCEFVFDGKRALDYAIGGTMKKLEDFTIEMDYSITNSSTGYCGYFGNKSSWSSDCINAQWGRSGYKPTLFWNPYFDGITGSSAHSSWIGDEQYHHVAFVRKGGTITLFDEGVPVTSYAGISSSLNLSVESSLSVGVQHVENSILPGKCIHFRVYPAAIYTEDFSGNLPSWVGEITTPVIKVVTPVSISGELNEPISSTQLSATVINGSSAIFAVSSGSSLPAGLTMTSGGLISGTPTTEGSGSSVILVTHPGAADKTITVNYSIGGMPSVGLVFYAPLSSSTQTAETGQTMNVVGVDAYTTEDGIPCATFDGSWHLYSTVTNIPTGASARSISFYAKALEYSSQRSVLGWGPQSPGEFCCIDYLNGSTLRFGGWYADTDYNIGSAGYSWNHVCCVYDGETCYIYVNGTLVASSPQALSTAYTDLSIGYCYGSWLGYIAAVRIYNRALSAAEILALSTEFSV